MGLLLGVHHPEVDDRRDIDWVAVAISHLTLTWCKLAHHGVRLRARVHSACTIPYYSLHLPLSACELAIPLHYLGCAELQCALLRGYGVLLGPTWPRPVASRVFIDSCLRATETQTASDADSPKIDFHACGGGVVPEHRSGELLSLSWHPLCTIYCTHRGGFYVISDIPQVTVSRQAERTQEEAAGKREGK